MRFPHRSLIRLSGPDTIALLERTVTNSVKDWAAGEVRYGALLTPQGKIISDYTVLRTDDGVLLDVHEDAAEDLMKRLKMFRLRAAVEIALDDTFAAVRDPDGSDPRSPTLWGRKWVPLAEAGDLIPDADWTANRIAAGVPEWGSDYRAAEVFPTDINMDVMGGIDYKKGCFVGQEVASRMKRRGKIRKRTLIVHGAGLTAGADILAGAPIGTVTSAAGDTGLALVRTDRLQKALTGSADLTCNEAPARFELQDWAEAELAALTETDDE
ncbi:YgfZ/GcvT domain-containing protein [Hyphomonas jannaschiana]|uniref:Putative aminomethyltransferase n=1 Tax=Hyphomonas jannaschiana VP2 TaxID=1280952 RepID=A0A059FBZ2_9PROT|nr:folate-binding protein YgfZ [Hyphomonas jannaschiana]KCZ88122.1 putative aminomethyltransferase [Hyphomonas jannaschiana VP2]